MDKNLKLAIAVILTWVFSITVSTIIWNFEGFCISFMSPIVLIVIVGAIFALKEAFDLLQFCIEERIDDKKREKR